MDNILILDTSGSMAGTRLAELKGAVIKFIDLIEKLELGDRIAIVQFGGQANVVCDITSNYTLLRRKVASLNAVGSTPMAEGLALGILQLKNTRPVAVGRHLLMPRVILMTDGEPDSKPNVLDVATQLGQLDFPISCVGVASCDQRLMGQIANITGGMFVMAEDINLLQLFFIRQVLLITYIQKMADSIESLLNREYLREYLEEKTGQPVSDAELDGFIVLMKHLVRTKEGHARGDDGPQAEEVIDPPPLLSCSCRAVFTVFLWLIHLALIGISIFTCVRLSLGSAGTLFPAGGSNTLFAISAASIAMTINCGCLCHMSYLRLVDSESVQWIVEVLAVVMLAVPQVLMFATVVGATAEFLVPSAIAIMSIIGTCFLCLCFVRCCSKS